MQKLNRYERLKKEMTPALFQKRLENVEWSRLTKEDRFYLSNFGIYASSLRPDHCMIRFRFDGGNVAPKTLRLLADIASREKAQVLLTARGQIELHRLNPRRLYPIWYELHEQGIRSYQTLSDNFRAIVTDPLSDCAADTQINTYPILHEIQKRFLYRSEWIGTIPRKFNTALIGRHTPSFNPWGNDLLFALARREHEWGFNLYLGGRFNAVAKSIDLFCTPEEVADLFESIARIYRDKGYRGSRSKTRLFHLLETVGMRQFRAWIQEESKRTFPPAAELSMLSTSSNQDHLLPIVKFGQYGDITPKLLNEAAALAEEQGWTVRLTPRQELWVFDPYEISEASSSKKSSKTSGSKAGYTTACAGSRYCALSLWDVKNDVDHLPMDRLKDLGITLGFSGCLKGCGRHYHADIGLIGLRTNLYGPTERAARIFLGALQSPDPAPARMLYYSVPLRKLNRLIETILEDFQLSRLSSFEEFSREVLAIYPIEFLQIWYIIRQLYPFSPQSIEFFLQHDHSLLIREIEVFEPNCFLGDLNKKIGELSHRVWDQTLDATANTTH